jgi:hypothetical protein
VSTITSRLWTALFVVYTSIALPVVAWALVQAAQ